MVRNLLYYFFFLKLLEFICFCQCSPAEKWVNHKFNNHKFLSVVEARRKQRFICKQFFFFFNQDTIELMQARVSALDSATLDQVEARLQVTSPKTHYRFQQTPFSQCRRLIASMSHHTDIINAHGASAKYLVHKLQYINIHFNRPANYILGNYNIWC